MASFILCVLIISALDIFGFVQLSDYDLQTPFFLIHLNDLLFLLILSLGIILPIMQGKFKHARINFPLYLLCGYTIFIIILSIYHGTPYRNAVRQGGPILYLLIVVSVPNLIRGEKELILSFRFLQFLILLAISAVLYQSITGYTPEFAYEPGALSYVYQIGDDLYRTYNPSSILVIFGFCLSYVIILHKFNIKAAILISICIIALILSYCRTNYVCMSLVLLIAPLMVFKKSRFVTFLKPVAVIIVFATIMYFGIGDIFINRFNTIFYEIGLGEGTYGERVEIAESVLNILQDQGRILLGYGFGHIIDMNTYTAGTTKEVNLLLSLNSGADGGWVHIFFRTGIIGVILFLYFIFAIIRDLYGKYCAESDLTLKSFLCAGILFICYGLIYNFTGNFFFYEAFSLVVAVVLGLAEAVPSNKEIPVSRQVAYNPYLKLTTSLDR